MSIGTAKVLNRARQGPVRRPQDVVWPCTRATILPPTPRPTDRLGGSVCRWSARYEKTHNYVNMNSNNESNNDAKNVPNNNRNDFANNSRYSEGLRLRSRSEVSSKDVEKERAVSTILCS